MKTETILVKENNDKRKQLTPDNLTYYEDMLVYIRLSFSKSDIATEEILSELLDHLLDAQNAGKTAYDVFREEPKQYAEEIVGSLPRKVPKNFIKYLFLGGLFYIGAKETLNGLLHLILFYGFSKGQSQEIIYTGTSIFKILLSLPIAFGLTYILILYLRWSAFKKMNKVLEFFIIWVWSVVSIGIFMLIIYLIPDIGPVFHSPHWISLAVGIILLLFGWSVLKRSK